MTTSNRALPPHPPILSAPARWATDARAFEWTSIAILLLCIDFVTGPYISFPITYIIPVSLAAWYGGLAPGIVLATVMPIIRMYFSHRWPVHEDFFDLASAAVLRVLVLASFAFIMAQLAEKSRLLAARVEVLEGILPICSFCKKIRDEEGHWQPVERYVTVRTRASFSHGFCDECMVTHYGEVSDGRER